jgi:glycerol-3-phosphate dehydrogenase (NAD(P)+)
MRGPRSRPRSRTRLSTETPPGVAEGSKPAGSLPTVAVLGSGSWGTALAVHLARSGHRSVLWGIETEELAAMARDRLNARYLPGVPLPEGLEIEPDFERAIRQAGLLLVVVPSHAFREVLERVRPLLRPGQQVAWATKGFELASGKLPHQVAAEVLGPQVPTAVLSGPTFAQEVGAGLPSAMTVAAKDEEFALALARNISSENFRAYASGDMVGVEVGGAVKNVLAIGAGISDGLGFGANTRVALITRGLAEMMRLGVALGADRETFMGLAGLGDLVLTCTDDQSRNRRMGLALAAGRSPEQAQAGIGQVVEGVLAARAVHEVAARHRVEMPIAEQIYRVLYAGLPPRDAVNALMLRTIKAEKG